MSNTIVFYKSKYGSTKKYAQWISEELHADLFEYKQVDKKKLMSYDRIIYGGGLYAGGMNGLSLIKNNFKELSEKKIIIFAVGGTLKKDAVLNEVADKNLSDEMKEKVPFFFFRGGFDYKKMRPFDRFLMILLYKSIKSKKLEELDDDSKGIIATYGKKVDFTNKNFIKPLIDLTGI